MQFKLFVIPVGGWKKERGKMPKRYGYLYEKTQYSY